MTFRYSVLARKNGQMRSPWVPPDLGGWDYWSLVLSKVFNFDDAGWFSLLSSIVVVLGCGLFLWGLAVLVADAANCLYKLRRWFHLQ